MAAGVTSSVVTRSSKTKGELCLDEDEIDIPGAESTGVTGICAGGSSWIAC
jgi:hypothetical protein